MHQIPTSRLLFVLVFAHSSFAAASNQTDTAALVKLAGMREMPTQPAI